MLDIIVAFALFAIIFAAITFGKWAIAIVLGIAALVMFMPTPDGIFYTYIFLLFSILINMPFFQPADFWPQAQSCACLLFLLLTLL